MPAEVLFEKKNNNNTTKTKKKRRDAKRGFNFYYNIANRLTIRRVLGIVGDELFSYVTRTKRRR